MGSDLDAQSPEGGDVREERSMTLPEMKRRLAQVIADADAAHSDYVFVPELLEAVGYTQPGDYAGAVADLRYSAERREGTGDLIRIQLQETGRACVAFLTLADIFAACDDLGIDARTVLFEDGYASVKQAFVGWDDASE